MKPGASFQISKKHHASVPNKQPAESFPSLLNNHEMMVASNCINYREQQYESMRSSNQLCTNPSNLPNCEGYSSTSHSNSGPNNTSSSSCSSSGWSSDASNNSTGCSVHPCNDARSKKLEQITAEQIQLYFGHTQTDAARLLGVSVSTLKRRFYELNLGNRWPYRRTKHTPRKNKSPTFHENIASQMMNVMVMNQYDGGLLLPNSKDSQHCIKQTSPMIVKPKKMAASLKMQPRQPVVVSTIETSYPKQSTMVVCSPQQQLSKLSLAFIMNPTENDELR